MNKFTVIAVDEQTGQITSDFVEAHNRTHAFYVAAEERPSLTFVVALDGHVMEGNGLDFPGQCMVDAETVLEQTDVFDIHDEPTPITSTVVVDKDIMDWRLASGDESQEVAAEFRDTYRMVIEQFAGTNQVYFTVYPKHLDGVTRDIPRNGLSGLLEIRDGKPAMSFGLNDENLTIHVESDIVNGFHVYHDSLDTYDSMFSSDSKGRDIRSLYYCHGEDGWLIDAREEVAAQHHNQHFDKQGYVKSSNPWCTTGDTLTRIVEFRREDGFENEVEIISVTFHPKSTMVKAVNVKAMNLDAV